MVMILSHTTTRNSAPAANRISLIGTDWLYPPQRSKEIQLAAMNVNVESSCLILYGKQGHDSFLFASKRYEKIIKTFIES
mgnify:CR=1 FL=1